MPRIKFPLGLTETEFLPRTRRDLKNCFNNGQNAIVGRPGITSISTPTGVSRGSFVWNGSLYEVRGQKLYKFTNLETGAQTEIGDIADSAAVKTDIGFNEAVIVVPAGRIYKLNTSDVLTRIDTGSNFSSCQDVCHINGRFIYIPANGDPAFFSDVGDAATVQAASFFDAENLPDKNNACFNLKETLFIAGTDSIQLFRNVATNSAVPFLPIQGSRILNGYIGGLLEYNNTFLFIGREKDQDRGIYSIAQGQAPKISNEIVDKILSTYTESELSDAYSMRFKWRGYDIAVFNLPNHTIGFYGGNWFTLDTIDNGTSKPWFSWFITQFQGTYYTFYPDNFGKLSTVNSDYGNPITRIIDTGVEQEDSDYFSIDSIELGISQGYNSITGTVGLAMSDDNVTYGPMLFRELGSLGQYNHKLIWQYPGGLGGYDGFAGIRIYTTSDIQFSSDHFIYK